METHSLVEMSSQVNLPRGDVTLLVWIRVMSEGAGAVVTLLMFCKSDAVRCNRRTIHVTICFTSIDDLFLERRLGLLLAGSGARIYTTLDVSSEERWGD